MENSSSRPPYIDLIFVLGRKTEHSLAMAALGRMRCLRLPSDSVDETNASR